MMLSMKHLVEHTILCDYPLVPLSTFRNITKTYVFRQLLMLIGVAVKRRKKHKKNEQAQ
jgi:hypothetical protein